MSKTAKRYALHAAHALDYGQVARSVCPTCHGGQSGETTFGVGREPDRVWWNCFRASCSESGSVGGHTIAPAEHTRRLARLKPYEGRTYMPTEDDFCYFAARFEIREATVRTHVRLTEDGEYAFPYRDIAGNIRGYVVRKTPWSGPQYHRVMDEYSGPKTITYPHTLEPVMGWCRPSLDRRDFGRVVVVEDMVSAMKVSEIGLIACSLLGAGWNAEKVRDIARTKPDRVTIALDPDAQGTAQQMRRKWGGYFRRCDIVSLEADPKDLDLEVLAEDLL